MTNTPDKQPLAQPASGDADFALDGLQTLWSQRGDRLDVLLAAHGALVHPAHAVPRRQSHAAYLPNAFAACFLLAAIASTTFKVQAQPFRQHGDITYAESIQLVQEALLQ